MTYASGGIQYRTDKDIEQHIDTLPFQQSGGTTNKVPYRERTHLFPTWTVETETPPAFLKMSATIIQIKALQRDTDKNQ